MAVISAGAKMIREASPMTPATASSIAWKVCGLLDDVLKPKPPLNS